MNSRILACPGCHKKFRIHSDNLKLALACPHCGQKVKAPGQPAELKPGVSGKSDKPQLLAAQGKNHLTLDPRPKKRNKKSVVAKRIKESTVSNPTIANSESEQGGGLETPVANSATKKLSANTKKKEKSVESKPKTADTFRSVPALPPKFQVFQPWSPNNQFGFDPSLGAVGTIEKSAADIATLATSSPNDRSPATNNGLRNNLPLPPKFDVVDPDRFRYRKSGSTTEQVVLPHADGGFQTVNDRVVTIEYKGQVYQLLTLSPEEKKRRELIGNLLAILIAVLAILITIYLLT